MKSKENLSENDAPLTNSAESLQPGSPQAMKVLREQAEEVAGQKNAGEETFGSLSPEETWLILHELRVHQIELEMQNEELRRTQIELEAAKERYFELYDLAPAGYVTVSEKGLILEANLTAETLLGVARKALLRQPLSRFIHKDDEDIWYLHCRQMLYGSIVMDSEGPACACELRMTKQDGTEFHAHMTARAAPDMEGCPVLRIVINDITERKKLQNQIQQSKRILQTMIDLHSESVFLMEPNGTVIAANRELALKMGRDPGQLIGHSIYEMLPEDIGRNRRKFVEEAVRTGKKVCFEDQRDGRHYVHFLNPDLNRAGSVSQISVLCVDITERRRMEDMLRLKAEQYHSFVETMKEGFIVLNKDMTVAYVNDEFCRLTRYEKKDLIGTSVLRCFDRRNQKTVTDAFKRQKNGEHASCEAEAVRKDRSRIYLRFSPRPIFDADRNFQGSFAVITNITDEKQTEKGLKQQMERSRKQKENLTREVESYNHAMRVLLKDKEVEIRDIELSFVTNVRNALTPMLDRLKNTCLNDRQKQIVQAIESSVASIVSPFIRRVKAEKWDFTPMELQIAHLIREGKRNKEIADIFNISESAVGFHRSNIRQKLGLKNAKVNLRTCLLRLSDQ